MHQRHLWHGRMQGVEQQVASLGHHHRGQHNLDYDKRHLRTIHKFRDRYDEIEIKCIFKPKHFNAIWDHHPKKNNLQIVSGIDCSATILPPFIEGLRETVIANGHLLWYHYRIISVENFINKPKTNSWHIKNKYTLDDLMSSDHNEVEDSTLRNKWLQLEHDRERQISER